MLGSLSASPGGVLDGRAFFIRLGLGVHVWRDLLHLVFVEVFAILLVHGSTLVPSDQACKALSGDSLQGMARSSAQRRPAGWQGAVRSEEHTSELQSRPHL